MLSLSLSSSIPHSYRGETFPPSTNNRRLHVYIKNQSSGAGIPTPDQEPNVIPPGLQRELMPKHVAVIMDGNRRWARSRRLMPQAGHLAGARALKAVIDLCRKWGIQALTVFAFSSDNWLRPSLEVDLLMGLLENKIKDEIANMGRQNIRVSVIGAVSKLPKSLRELINHAVNTTKNNSRLDLVMAINYSGKYDIVQACRSIAVKVKDGVVEPDEINELMVDKELGMQLPHPDLLIRTSGEVRVSNFYLWQLAYTELYFTETLWPDFGEDELLHALHVFQQRPRRYGA